MGSPLSECSKCVFWACKVMPTHKYMYLSQTTCITKKFGTCTLVGTCSLFDLSLTVLSYESPKVHVVWVKKAHFWLYILNNSRWVKPLAELGIGLQGTILGHNFHRQHLVKHHQTDHVMRWWRYFFPTHFGKFPTWPISVKDLVSWWQTSPDTPPNCWHSSKVTWKNSPQTPGRSYMYMGVNMCNIIIGCINTVLQRLYGYDRSDQCMGSSNMTSLMHGRGIWWVVWG